MRILHYFLGFPPYRTGGLTKYATDLMLQQLKDGNEVIGLWPGRFALFNCTPHFFKAPKYHNISSYELINPLPVALDEGVKDIASYTKACSTVPITQFLNTINPDIIHVHTLMGLYKEFIEVAQSLGIKTIFTTHDYYGLCPKVTLYRYGTVCTDDHNCVDCIQCNETALSISKIKIMQSPLYRYLKNSPMVRYIRSKHRSNYFSNDTLPIMPNIDIDSVSKEYIELRAYYVEILKKIDLIHFNSTLTESIYKKYFSPNKSIVSTITHSNITDNRSNSFHSTSDHLRITCLAPAKPFKGFNILKQALDELWNSGKHNFTLNVFSHVETPATYMNINPNGYKYDALCSILSNTDVVIIPSIWYETFGFTVLESLSYGIPVIVTNHVGAKDIVKDGGIIIDANDSQQLKDAISSLTPDHLNVLHENIIKHVPIKLWNELVEETYKMYTK